jgi:hypothetical protein
MNVEGSRYQTKHIGSAECCAHVTVSNEIVEMIDRGNIPLVSWWEGKLEITEYNFQSQKPESEPRFVAISHV